MNRRHCNSWSVRLLFFVVFSAAALSFAANRPAAKAVPAGDQALGLASYGKLPLSFEENRGQADARVKFLSQGSGYTLLLSPGAVELNLAQPQQDRRAALRMSFPGAKSAPLVTGAGRQSAISSYFVGKDPAKWVTGAPNYARVRYEELYPGVDLVFYGNQRQLEYDLVVAPGADPSVVQMQFDGIDSMRVDSAGNLVLGAGTGELRQHRPIVYQERDGMRQSVNGSYVIQAHNRVAFQIASYDTSKPLIIDPVLTFATYLGTPGEDLFGLSATAVNATYPAVAVDSQGNVYLTGFNGGTAANFPGPPVTLTAPSGGGGTEVFVVKMNSTGTALLYSVVFGGGLTDVGGGIAVDTSGNAYVTGYTSSTNFPITASAAQPTLHGPTSAFVAKVNAAGTQLSYSTYLGGTGNDWGRSIAVDHSGNAHVTGTAQETAGTTFPLVNPISSTPASGFLTEVNSNGTAFVYSTFLSAGIGYGVALDSGGNAYVTGTTGTSTTPSPARAYVLKVNAAGSSITYGPVFLGSSGAGLQSIGFGIALDAQGDAYVTGLTNDSHFPVTSGAAQTTYGGGLTDAFAVKLGPSGSLPPIYATYIGGIGSNILPERGSGIAVDGAGYAYVAGTTQCIGFPVANQLAGALNGGPATLMKGSLSGSSSTWSPTSLAGDFDQVTALAFDATGTTFYAGATAVNTADGGGIYKSTNDGSTWTAASTGIASTTIDAIAVDPSTSTTVYAIAGGRIYKSTNSGTSWGAVGPAVGAFGSLAIASTSPSTIYAGSSTGLLYSTSSGTSWTSVTVPLPVTSLVVDPNTHTTAYAATGSGVYKTTNAGVSWSAANGTVLPAGIVTSLAMNSTGTLYAATPSGLFYTLNGGSSWTHAILGFIPGTPMLVAVDSGNNVYVAFAGSGVGVGTNGGLSQGDWSVLTYNGLTQNQILALAVQPGVSGTAFAGMVSATDAFLTRISPDGGSFTSSTCIGGTDNNLGQNIAVTPAGTAYISGATTATNFPTTAGVIQPSLAGLYDAFVAGVSFQDQIISPIPGITLSGTLADFSWNAVSGATEYLLTVGTTPGGGNIFSGTTTATSQTVGFIPCNGGTVYVQLASEVNGSFQPATESTYPCKSAIGDFNGNHFQDLIWQNNSSGQVNVNFYAGAGPQPQGSTVLNNGSNLNGWLVVGAGDFDRNGVQDLVLQNQSTGQVNVNYYGSPGGTTFIGWACLSCSVNITGWSVVGVADMDGNGVPDLIYQNQSTSQVNVNYFGGSGGAVFQGFACLSCGINVTGWQVKAVADFDGNGVPDLVYQNQSTSQVNVNYYGGSGGATFQGFACLSCGINVTGWKVVGADDWNADEVPDLVYQNQSTGQVNVDYYGGSGGAVFKGWNCLNCAAPLSGWLVRTIAKFGSSGEPNLIWQNTTTNAVSVYYYSLGGSVFQGFACLSCGIDTSAWQVVGTGDFDGNGVPDLVYQNRTTAQVNVDYYGGSGGTTFIGWACLSCGINVTGWQVKAVADFDGNGVPDLVYQNQSTSQVNVNYYGGSGGSDFQGFACLSCGINVTGWQVKAAADFDGNGVPDLVYQNQTSNQVNVNYYEGSGGDAFKGWACLSCGINVAGWTVVGASDFDGNGVPDLVYQNQTLGRLNVDYYGGSGGSVLKGWNALNNYTGWTVIVPKSR